MSDTEYEREHGSSRRADEPLEQEYEHGTAEGWLSGCRCRACEKAQPDANVQAAAAQGAAELDIDRDAEQAAVNQADGQTGDPGAGTIEREGQQHADPNAVGGASYPVDTSPGTKTSGSQVTQTTTAIGGSPYGEGATSSSGVGYPEPQTKAERDAERDAKTNPEPGD